MSLLFPFLRNPGKTFYHFFLPPSHPPPYPSKKHRRAPWFFCRFCRGRRLRRQSTPDEMGSCSSQGCMSGCYGQRSLRGTWPWDHPPVVGSNDMPRGTIFVSNAANGEINAAHGETPPGQQEANVISESVFLMFLAVSFGGSKSKIEQNNTQLWII